jgi:ubiquinone/menaquinone biosynthesis C-methylase UbiE
MTAMAEPSRFWDRLADRYSRQPIADEAAYQTKLRVTREYLRPDMEVLEFGCGTGGTALSHAPFVRHIRAVDFSKNMLEIARSKAEAQRATNVTFEQADVTELKVADGTYDVVMGMSILHLMKDRRAVIAKVFRMLKPGGHFISSTTCMGDTMKVFRTIAPVGRALGFLPILDVMTVGELVGSMTDAGFTIDHQWQPSRDKAVFIVATKPQ